MDAAHGADQRVVRHSLDDVAARPSLQCLVDILIALVSCENDELGIWMAGHHGTDGLDAAHSRKAKVHERDVGKVLFEKLDGLFAASRLGNRCHVRRGLNDGRDADAHDGMVVDNENAYSWLIPSIAACSSTAILHRIELRPHEKEKATGRRE